MRAGVSIQGEYLETLTWPEAEEALDRYATALIPVGARTKEHGLHLPLNTDWLQAEYLTHRIVERCAVLALPTLPYGYYPAFVEYPGSVHLRLEIFRDTVIDICGSLARHGGQRFYVLNTGISTHWALEPARLILADAGIVMDYTDLTAITREDDAAVAEQPEGSHADELETSTMLYIAPEVVHMDRAHRDIHPRKGPGPLTRNPRNATGQYSPTGAWGDPTLASREKGARLTEILVNRLVTEISALMDENFQPAPPRQQYL